MLNPNRPEVEKVYFPDEDAVAVVFRNMDKSLEVINELANDPSIEALDVVSRNKDYLKQCLAFQTMQEAGKDLTPYQF